jgi:hypothetical protein
VRRHSKAIVATFASMLLTCAFGVTSAIAAPPVVTIDPPSDVSYTSAHVSGTINPEAEFVFFYFQYSANPASDGWTSTPEQPPLESGVGPVNVSADLKGLKPGTEYQIRLVAEGFLNGTTISAEPNPSFTTPISAPTVVTGSANDLTGAAATLRGTIDPHGLQSVYYFEYGPTVVYGSRAPVDHDSVAGDGLKALHVAQSASDLQPETEYHYRLVGTSSAGTSYGSDATFTTAGSSEDVRAFEMVSPLDKGGSNVDVEVISNFQATPEGNGLVFATKTAMSGTAEAAPLLPKYFSSRSESDWSPPVALDPPQIPGSITPKLITTLAVSEDGTKALVISLKALAPGASDGDSNVYLRDIASGAFTTIATTPGPDFDKKAHFVVNVSLVYLGGTPNFDHVLISGMCCSLLPGTPNGSAYEWTNGELRVASIGLGGTPFESPSEAGSTTDHTPHYMSADGSRIYFNNEGAGYLRRNGTTTVSVGGPIKAASRDGRFAFYSTGSLWRYDDNTESSQLIATGVESEDILQASEDGQYVYFMSTTSFAGAPPGTNLYVWHEGTIQYIASFDLGREGRLRQWMASPSGRYLGFTAYTQLSAYDNSSSACQNFDEGDPGNSCREAYLYDTETEELTCASCRVDGEETTGNADIGVSVGVAEFSHHFPRSMLDNGELIFDTPDSLSASDTNSFRDVYSFAGGQARLISGGKGDGDSRFADASVDGANIFFTTTDQLVGRDTDTLVDVYDARVDGGLASQNPPQARGECVRDDCKATPNQGPELPFGGSEGLNGPTNVKPSPHRRCGKGRHIVKVHGKVRCIKQKRRHGDRRQGR